MNNGICYIIGAGEHYEHTIKLTEHDYVIAADGGYDYIYDKGIKADLLIGDFDSIKQKPKHDNIVELQPEKDETDMLVSINEGLKRGYETFHIYGGTGGRIDHTIANLQCLAYLSKKGAQGFLFDKTSAITAITNGSMQFDEAYVGMISVLSYTNYSSGVNIMGLKYELNNGELTNEFPIGVSNEFIGIPASISVGNGTLLIIRQTDKY